MKYIFYIVLIISVLVTLTGVFGDLSGANVKNVSLTPLGVIVLPFEIATLVCLLIGAFGIFSKAKWGYAITVISYILLLVLGLFPFFLGGGAIGLSLLLAIVGLLISVISRKLLQV